MVAIDRPVNGESNTQGTATLPPESLVGRGAQRSRQCFTTSLKMSTLSRARVETTVIRREAPLRNDGAKWGPKIASTPQSISLSTNRAHGHGRSRQHEPDKA